MPVARIGNDFARTVKRLRRKTLTNRNSKEPGARAGRGSGPGTEGRTEGTGPERTVYISKKRLYRESILSIPNGSAPNTPEPPAKPANPPPAAPPGPASPPRPVHISMRRLCRELAFYVPNGPVIGPPRSENPPVEVVWRWGGRE